MEKSLQYARQQADGYDNIAPTPLQGQQAWQFAQSDNFLSAEEAAAVMRRQLEPYQAQIEAKLTQLGYPPEHLDKLPQLKKALYSGQQTDLATIWLTDELKMEGRLRVILTENGPDIRITPALRSLTIPDEVGGVKLSEREKKELAEEGALSRPLLLADKGDYVPTYLRVDTQTNTVELWRLRPEMLPTKLLGIDLTRDQQLQLANGHAIRLSGLLDKQGESFTATVSISAAQKELQFTDISPIGVQLRPDQRYREQLAQNNEGAKTDLTKSQEVATGQTTVSHFQREQMQQLLEEKPDQNVSKTTKHHLG
ncbi:hypothetical protein GCM10023189_32650 [Nibrella saemangeumensis]|uniref:DUF3945 domain-containing protein n=1 Tax=Nibrella saemangeumensis TaxID=1084526 RepID=A0ABP8N3F4_9BACT